LIGSSSHEQTTNLAIPMNLPDLQALQTGDADAWNAAFDWLWPTVFAVAQLKLQPYFPNEVEDVAIEALEELVEKVRAVKSVEELKPLAASIAHHRAVSLAAATAIVLLVMLPMFRTPSTPVIQLAMLDTTGGTRGTDTNDAALLRETWSKATLDTFTSAEALREWETNGKPDAVKIIYDRAAAEVRVLGKWREKSFEKTLPVGDDLKSALEQAQAFIREQTGL
jgi:hypothetical protein